ncbi:hypothetical protein T484DRAFT_1853261 [Baffinella frigidus]|nr:hypothetical protein T484DRAFT_1853261 [Cryptophyta sp. CCMP2293]
MPTRRGGLSNAAGSMPAKGSPMENGSGASASAKARVAPLLRNGSQRTRGSSRSTSTSLKRGAEQVDLQGVGGVGLVLVAGAEGFFLVKTIEPNGPAALNGMVRVGDKLVSVSGEEVHGAAGERIREISLGVPDSVVRLGLERLDRITGRSFVYEINVQRAMGPSASGEINDRTLPPETEQNRKPNP